MCPFESDRPFSVFEPWNLMHLTDNKQILTSLYVTDACSCKHLTDGIGAYDRSLKKRRLTKKIPNRDFLDRWPDWIDEDGAEEGVSCSRQLFCCIRSSVFSFEGSKRVSDAAIAGWQGCWSHGSTSRDICLSPVRRTEQSVTEDTSQSLSQSILWGYFKSTAVAACCKYTVIFCFVWLANMRREVDKKKQA